jgi:hypothetical protein
MPQAKRGRKKKAEEEEPEQVEVEEEEEEEEEESEESAAQPARAAPPTPPKIASIPRRASRWRSTILGRSWESPRSWSSSSSPRWSSLWFVMPLVEQGDLCVCCADPVKAMFVRSHT